MLSKREPDFISKPDMVDHPAHYNFGKYEVIDIIEDWAASFCIGNAIKYLARFQYKDNAIGDLKKALWYIKREYTRNHQVYKRGSDLISWVEIEEDWNLPARINMVLWFLYKSCCGEELYFDLAIEKLSEYIEYLSTIKPKRGKIVYPEDIDDSVPLTSWQALRQVVDGQEDEE